MIPYIDVLTPIATFVLGFLISRFTLSKKDRIERKHQVYKNSQQIIDDQQNAFQEFCKALNLYINKQGPPDANDFFEIATKGEKYFYVQSKVASSIIAGEVDEHTRDSVLIPKLKDTTERTLPNFYQTLQEISKKCGIQYQGKLREEDYPSLFKVVRQYG